ncbi:MAG: DUF3465 domain-containing protein [Phycisphaerales bacterium]
MNLINRHGRPQIVSTLVVLLVAGLVYLLRGPEAVTPGLDRTKPVNPAARESSTSTDAGRDGGIAALFRQRTSDTWVEAEGRIVKVLRDDSETDGGRNARHQRLLVELDTGVTVLLAHNIDAAPRVPAREGDPIRFRGEYEWSEKGGTVHFTHAPKHGNSIQGGWIEHQGKRYR